MAYPFISIQKNDSRSRMDAERIKRGTSRFNSITPLKDILGTCRFIIGFFLFVHTNLSMPVNLN